MVKQHSNRRSSIEDAQYAEVNYEDNHYDGFRYLLFDHLLSNIRKIPFDHIIQNYLQYNDSVYKTKEAYSLFWLYTADRKLINPITVYSNPITVYSFRFANACHPELYETFETKAHHLFLPIIKRHKYYGWHKCIAQELLNDVDKYLNIGRVIRNDIPHKTKVFINQKQERLDIEFNFYSINERISITFEPAYPANDRID